MDHPSRGSYIELRRGGSTQSGRAHLKTGWMRPHMARAVFTPIGFGSTKSHATRSCKLQTDRQPIKPPRCDITPKPLFRV